MTDCFETNLETDMHVERVLWNIYSAKKEKEMKERIIKVMSLEIRKNTYSRQNMSKAEKAKRK